jgi:hypothetical protein
MGVRSLNCRDISYLGLCSRPMSVGSMAKWATQGASVRRNSRLNSGVTSGPKGHRLKAR